MARKTSEQVQAELAAAFAGAPDGTLSYAALAGTVNMTPQHLQVLAVIAVGEVAAVSNGAPVLVYRLKEA
jgi:hypothetical protein